MVRRLNKLESRRLDTRLESLDAEVTHSKWLISQEQQALRKQLQQIKEVKRNPTVGLERRKLMQSNSYREMLESSLGITQTAQQGNRWLSDSSAEFPRFNVRPRSKSTNNPPSPRGFNLESSLFPDKVFRGNNVNNSMPQRVGWKRGQRSYSANFLPLLLEWESDGRDNDEINSFQKPVTDVPPRRGKVIRCWDDPFDTRKDHQTAASFPCVKGESGDRSRRIENELQSIKAMSCKRNQMSAKEKRRHSTSGVPLLSERGGWCSY